MSRDLFGDFGDFQSSTGPTSNNTFSSSAFPSFPATAARAQPPSGSGNARPKSQNFDDLLGLFDSKPAAPSGLSSMSSFQQPAPSFSNQSAARPQYQSDFFSTTQSQSQSLQAPRPPLQAASSQAIISGTSLFDTKPSTSQPSSTTLFSASPQQNPADDDDFGDFAEEPLPSSNPTFGPFSNYTSSPPRQQVQPAPPVSNILLLSNPPPEPEPKQQQQQQKSPEDDFGNFIFTPRIPTPPPQSTPFNLSTSITNPNHSHPPHPPPHLHQLLPILTTTLLSPLPFLNRLKPLSYPAKQRLLSSSPRVKSFFTGVIYTAHVTGRLIASKKIRPRRTYKSPSSSNAAGKLATTSRTDAMKDEREIAECVREYGEIVGSLRAVVRGMGLVVPEIMGEMPVTSAAVVPAGKNGSGGGGGGKKGQSSSGKDEFCWLCGLGPLDRVSKLKEEGLDGVEALGGGKKEEEWWVGGWGHRSCRNWWEGCGKGEVKM
ncbi:hypothetical protein ABW19_dt0201470 [Dactylella cylindrospora]|nr:hypothetical protein ABW19_dt0201470 [Dactylella cylindrospora]